MSELNPIICITAARMGSSRLKGKVLKTIGGHSLLKIHVERLRLSQRVDQVIVATTTNYDDHQIVEECERLAIPYYRGDEQDVLSRYYHAAETFGAQTVVRVTSDCPLIDPSLIDRLILKYQSVSVDYGHIDVTHYPRGMDAEIFSMDLLKEINDKASLSEDREHVSRYIYTHPELYRLMSYRAGDNFSQYRLCVDEEKDYMLVSYIIEHMMGRYGDNFSFSFDDVMDYLKSHPHIALLNYDVQQKKS